MLHGQGNDPCKANGLNGCDIPPPSIRLFNCTSQWRDGSWTCNRVWHLDAPQRQSQVRKEKSEAWKCFGETNDRSSQLMNVGALSVFGFPTPSFLSDQMPHLKQRTLSFPAILCTFSLGLGQECALLDPLNGYFYFQL